MLAAVGTLSGVKTTLVLPDTFMNRSGSAAGHYIKNKKGAGNLIVIHDELDMPLGTMKISYGRSSGGHNGVESIIKALKTNEFVRIRIGVSKKSARGIALKPKGESNVVKFILAKFSSDDSALLKKVYKRVVEAVEVIVADGRQAAMNQFN